MKIFKIKDKNGLYSNGKKFTKKGKIFTTEASLTNHIIQNTDKFQYVNKDIKLVIIEFSEKEIDIEPFIYEKLKKYSERKTVDNAFLLSLQELYLLAQDKIKNGFEIDGWE